MKKTNSTKSHSKSSAPLTALARRLYGWRAARQRGQRIPEDLWKAATQLARVHGLNPTASALKLNYYDLQRRLREDPAEPSKHSSAAAFVELPVPAIGSASAAPSTLELTRPDGARLSLGLNSVNPTELSVMIQGFLAS